MEITTKTYLTIGVLKPYYNHRLEVFFPSQESKESLAKENDYDLSNPNQLLHPSADAKDDWVIQIKKSREVYVGSLCVIYGIPIDVKTSSTFSSTYAELARQALQFKIQHPYQYIERIIHLVLTKITESNLSDVLYIHAYAMLCLLKENICKNDSKSDEKLVCQEERLSMSVDQLLHNPFFRDERPVDVKTLIHQLKLESKARSKAVSAVDKLAVSFMIGENLLAKTRFTYYVQRQQRTRSQKANPPYVLFHMQHRHDRLNDPSTFSNANISKYNVDIGHIGVKECSTSLMTTLRCRQFLDDVLIKIDDSVDSDSLETIARQMLFSETSNESKRMLMEKFFFRARGRFTFFSDRNSAHILLLQYGIFHSFMPIALSELCSAPIIASIVLSYSIELYDYIGYHFMMYCLQLVYCNPNLNYERSFVSRLPASVRCSLPESATREFQPNVVNNWIIQQENNRKTIQRRWRQHKWVVLPLDERCDRAETARSISPLPILVRSSVVSWVPPKWGPQDSKLVYVSHHPPQQTNEAFRFHTVPLPGWCREHKTKIFNQQDIVKYNHQVRTEFWSNVVPTLMVPDNWLTQRLLKYIQYHSVCIEKSVLLKQIYAATCDMKRKTKVLHHWSQKVNEMKNVKHKKPSSNVWTRPKLAKNQKLESKVDQKVDDYSSYPKRGERKSKRKLQSIAGKKYKNVASINKCLEMAKDDQAQSKIILASLETKMTQLIAQYLYLSL